MILDQPGYKSIVQQLEASAEVKRKMVETRVSAIAAAAAMVSAALGSGRKLLLCGNGGSAADCQHMAAEFVSSLSKDVVRQGLPAIALTTDTSFLTAYANDYGFEGVFARQVEALGREGDVLLGISTSGNSKNVIRAFEKAKQMGIRTIALTGDGGIMPQIADLAVTVPSNDTQRIQEAHLLVEHIICSLVEDELCRQPAPVGGHSHDHQ